MLGAGIVGAACARELAHAGARVRVVERDTIGSGATAAGMGHLVAMDDSPAQFALSSYSQTLWEELAKDLPDTVEYSRCGTIWVATDEEEMAEVGRKLAFYRAHGVAAEVLDGAALAVEEPNLRGSMAGGLLVPGDRVLYPPCAAAYLLGDAVQRGAEVMYGEAVSAERGRVRLVDGRELEAEILVNALGAHSPALTPGIAVRRRKGHLVITDRYPGFLRHQLIELGYLKSAHSLTTDSVAFNVQPRATGQILIGSSRQYGEEASGVDQEILTAMLKRAAMYMPRLNGLSAIRVWSGFRAATPDKLPLIGPTEDPTVFLATGHEGLGITTSLGTGRLLADYILRRPSAIPIAPYLPARMASVSGRELAAYA